MTIRVLVVDDQPLMRAAFEMTLRAEDDIEHVGEAADGREAIAQARALHPDVILMDIRMPLLDGIAATRHLKQALPACRVIALTVHGYAEARQRATAVQVRIGSVLMKSGCSLMKSTPSSANNRAVSHVATRSAR